MKIINKYRKGFGLLEVLLSAVIIIIILSALVTIGRAAMSNNESLSQRAQAIYLAQEGIEMVRQIRDTNWMDGSSVTKWNTLDGVNIAGSDSYKLSFTTGSDSRALLASDSAGENITVGGVTFNRKITASTSAIDALLPNSVGSPDLSPYAIKAKSTVTWTYSGRSKSIELSEILTDWRPTF